MKGITVKLPEETLRRLQKEAEATGRSAAAFEDRSVYALTADFAGSVSGGRKSATNARRRFRRQ